MCTDSRAWDWEVISDIFNVTDQERIQATSIEAELNTDVLQWEEDITGQYTVKSAYKLLQVKKEVHGQQSGNFIWKGLWQVKAPRKALDVLWRALSLCLPTKAQLHQKRVNIDTICEVCRTEVEDTSHIFLRCPFAVQCWEILQPSAIRGQIWEFASWFERCFLKEAMDNRARMATLCWSIWRFRNDVVWNKKISSSERIVADTTDYLSQWKMAQNRFYTVPLQPSVHGDGAEKWVKPQQHTVKITVDAAIFEEIPATGMGLIARDHTGGLLWAKTKLVQELMHPSMAEAVAIKEALSWLKNLGWESVIIESDCLVAIQSIRSSIKMRSRFGRVIEECRKMVEDSNNTKLYFIKRSANRSAHELARMSHMYPDRSFDRSSIPVMVNDCILLDSVD
ncbi:hypothetical protein AgCh_036428 [Apium graveolens]